MSIAFFDADRAGCTGELTIWNLHLMKMSTYYRRRREMVSMITDISRARYYEKVCYFQDDLDITPPEGLERYDNIEFFGIAINGDYGNIPDEIEACPYDTSIYEKLDSKYDNPPCLPKDNHILLYKKDGTSYPYNTPTEAVRSVLHIHDTKLYPGWSKLLSQYLIRSKEKINSVVFVHPIEFQSLDCYMELLNFTPKYHRVMKISLNSKEELSIPDFVSFLNSKNGSKWFKNTQVILNFNSDDSQEIESYFLTQVKKAYISTVKGQRYHFIPPVFKKNGWTIAFRVLRVWSAQIRKDKKTTTFLAMVSRIYFWYRAVDKNLSWAMGSGCIYQLCEKFPNVNQYLNNMTPLEYVNSLEGVENYDEPTN